MKSQIAICCAVDSSYTFHLATMLFSLFHHNQEEEFDVYLLHSGLNSQEVVPIERIVNSFSNRLHLILVDDQVLEKAPIFGHVSIATYFRILVPNLLPKGLSRVLYLDSDILVLVKVRRIWELELGDHLLAAVRDGEGALYNYLGLREDEPYFNAGVLVIDLEGWRNEAIAEKAYKFLVDNPEKIKYWDQDALNFVLRDRWKEMGSEWNFIWREGLREANSLGRIIHFIGEHKPWNYYCNHPMKGLYHSYRKKAGLPPIKFVQDSLTFRTKAFLRNLIK
ncbi:MULTISPECIES: glycosyltransferase family 8 protein [unclassified Imperialibacter]|uniref:glycosyltransferase family 8 protein n=1 Tax=unclassified Imperialibacter TaxID=2629706 RepID=UPI00125AB289|nr:MULTISPECIES: glycosyltransferase family 8 protein [unclassified Imperialibacter]CAD5259179.1 putative General stress protein A [Imperialibacter sp. 89]CAD5280006.1 putative General stress protein A [Imperialibacter sp. 75]VVT31793.1 putative General stress protein A [Imperialibacter sp. EC-SDR9]